MAKPPPSPPFEIPFTDNELVVMGKIAVLWGQVDEGFNEILRWVLRLHPKVYESLLGNQMIGSRITHLRAAAHYVTKAKNKQLLFDLADKLNDVLPERNAAMHGCWGRFVLDPTYKNFRIGTYNHQKSNKRFYVDQLGHLYRRLVDVMMLVAELELRSIEEDYQTTIFKDCKIYFTAEFPDDRAEGVNFERGDRVLRVEPKFPGSKTK